MPATHFEKPLEQWIGHVVLGRYRRSILTLLQNALKPVLLSSSLAAGGWPVPGLITKLPREGNSALPNYQPQGRTTERTTVTTLALP